VRGRASRPDPVGVRVLFGLAFPNRILRSQAGTVTLPGLPVSMPAAWVQASRPVTRVGEKGDNLSPFFRYPGGRKGRHYVREKGDMVSPELSSIELSKPSTTPAREDKKSRSRRSCRAGPPGRIR
jgi:hypothetical protein